MTQSDKFEELLAGFEGLRLEAYRDQKGIPTIGIGTIEYEDGTAVKMGDTITKERAFQLMRGDLAQRCIKVSSLLAGVDLKPHQFDAILSFTYNVGTAGLANSTLLKLVRENPNSEKEGKVEDLTVIPRIIVALNNAGRGQGNLIALAFYMWSFAGGKFDRGLLSRRVKEANLYLYGYGHP